MFRITTAGACAIALLCLGGEAAARADRIDWVDLPALPQAMSGHFVGVHNDTPIVAGGTRWPVSPFQGGTKVWLDTVYILPGDADEWRPEPLLDRPGAYGAAVSTKDGVICAGGSDGTQHCASVVRLAWEGGAVKRKALPDLPLPCAYMAAARVGGVMYVAGGQVAPDSTEALRRFWALDLEKEHPRWEELEPWPGPARILPVAAAQDGGFYLFSGADLARRDDGTAKRRYLNDAYCYRPGEGWRRISDVPRPVVAAPAAALGPAHVLVFSGDDGELVERIDELGDDHPGFPKTVLAYHTITDTWVELGTVPESYVTSSAVPWQDGFVIPGGEDRPGHRGGRVLFGKLAPRKDRLHPLDYAMLLAYIAVLVLMGFYFSRREKSTDDFFLGGRRVPWWAAGISIFGTLLSAITFLAVPATAFAKDWMYFMGNITAILVAPLVVFLYLPFFRRLTVASAYEYLEKRFNVGVRIFGSAAFVLFQLGRVGIVLLLPAMALSAATGIDEHVAIAGMGVLCTLYTVLGGIEAVIWTDVIQVVVLIGGALVALALTVLGVEGGPTTVIAAGWADDKFHMFNWTWDYTAAAVWVVLVGRTLETIIPYTTDQTVIQRYLTTATDREAAKAVWTGALFSIPNGMLFLGIGTALYVFYKSHPELLDPGLQNDAILPLFVVQHFPAGVAGLVIAAVFAAAMSSLDSSLNSVSAVIVTDYYQRFNRGASERSALLLARVLTVLIGAAGTGTALFMASANISSLWEHYMLIIGLFGGALAGVFALGVFTRRANGFGALIGAACGAAILYLVKTHTPVSFLLYSSIGICSSFAIGYVASLILGGTPRDLDGLTWPTRKG